MSPDAAELERGHRLQDVEHGTAEPVDTPHDDDVPAPCVVGESCPPGPVRRARGAGDDVFVDVLGVHAGLEECGALERGILLPGADPRVADERHVSYVSGTLTWPP